MKRFFLRSIAVLMILGGGFGVNQLQACGCGPCCVGNGSLYLCSSEECDGYGGGWTLCKICDS